jgi:glycosyltransferase involved in cell wall biosynthesis
MPDPCERDPIATAPITVALPAYNVERTLAQTLTSWITYLDSLERDYEVLLVDDGSSDQTATLTESFSEKNGRIRLLRHAVRAGFGACLRTALAAARHPLFFYSDCTNSYQPTDLRLLLEVIDQVDLVTGYRVDARGKMPFSWKKLVSRCTLRFLFGVHLRDADCCFKLFRRSIFRRIPIQSDGSFVHTEIVAKANFLGCLITEVPVRYEPPPCAGSPEDSTAIRRAEAFRVFRHPNFGPAQLPEELTLP